MATLIAVTNIKCGFVDDDGNRVSVWVDAGEFITDQLPADTIEELQASGAIAEPIKALANGADARALIQALEDKLAEVQKQQEETPEALLQNAEADGDDDVVVEVTTEPSGD